MIRKILAAITGLAALTAATAMAPERAAADPVTVNPAANAAPETYYYFVFANPTSGKDAVFNRWYSHRHIFDVVSVPGFVSAQRFELNPDQLRPAPQAKPKYLAIYKIVTADLPAVMAEVRRRIVTGRTVIDPSFDQATSEGYIYRAFRPEQVGIWQGPAPGMPAQIADQIVFSAFVPGQEDAFNAWYDTHHLPDVLSVPGFASGQRLILTEQRPPRPGVTAAKYVALFHIVTPDLSGTLAAFRSHAPSMKLDPSFDSASTMGYTYRAIGPLIDGDAVRKRRAKHG